jgi:predicted nucleic acid-binding protein
MTIVDSSSWIEALRLRGIPEVRKRVENLLDAGEAAWCPIIRMELWRGVGGAAERKKLQLLETRIPMLNVEMPVWNQAFDLLIKARGLGVTAPVTDVLIVATARFHNVDIEHCDWHLKALVGIL